MKTRTLTIVALIFAAALTRLVPHPYNFAPMTAVALFGGAHFSKKAAAFLVPLAAMLIGDVVLGFHITMPFVYASFAVTVALGFWVRQSRSVGRIAMATGISSALFFIVTNFGVWAFQSLYPKTVAGLGACYVAALPFLQQTILGDALYTAALFGTFALAEKWVPTLREIPAAQTA